MTYDSATWLAFALVLTALGGAATWISWQRRGLGPALRWLAITMLPLAAWLTGTLRLVVDIAGDVGHWASRLVFSPSVWAGIILAGIAVMLFGVGGSLKNRGLGSRTKDTKAADQGGGDAKAVRAPKAKQQSAGQAKGKQPADDGLDDDISDILKRHGIS